MTAARLVAGKDLPSDVRRAVLACFVNRYTGQHKPAWASREDCRHCVPSHATDDQWVDDHAFRIKKDGTLGRGSAEPACMAD